MTVNVNLITTHAHTLAHTHTYYNRHAPSFEVFTSKPFHFNHGLTIMAFFVCAYMIQMQLISIASIDMTNTYDA